ncbi:MAG: ATP-binding protein [Alphaproteobacteria bacterium]
MGASDAPDGPKIDRAALVAALDALPEAIAVRGADGEVLHENRAGRRRARIGAPGDGGTATVRRMPLGPDRTLEILVDPAQGTVFREILDALDCSVVVYDADERYVFGNRAFHGLYPFHPAEDELVGRSFEAMLRSSVAFGHVVEPQADSDPEGFVQRRLEEFRTMGSGHSERLLSSGQWHLAHVQFLPEGYRISARTDITEQKRTQEELRQAMQRLEAEGSSRRAYLDLLSRELRTPLGAVLGYAELIEGEVLGPIGSDKYREYAALIRHAGQLLLALIDDVLDGGQAGPGALEMRAGPVDLVDLLRRELTVVEPMARQNQTAIFLDLPDRLPRIQADPRMVRQMVLNLLSNAVKFTVQKTVTVTLRRRADGGIDLVVADRGTGMPPEALARVGEPYYRGERPEEVREPGTGLGLAVVKELLALHGGHLLLASAVGRGTTATLRFPAERTLLESSP